MFAPTDDDDANQLVNDDPFALLIGMLLDQQISINWAFQGPLRLSERLGERFTACAMASMDEKTLVDAFCAKPAVHRFPAVMARRAHELATFLCDAYGGEVEQLWAEVGTGDELFARLRALPGFGDEKAKILLAILAKRFGIQPDGWETNAGAFSDDQPRSAADADGPKSRAAIVAWKKRQRERGLTKQD